MIIYEEILDLYPKSMDIDFNKIYKEIYPKVLSYISRLAGVYEAEDITQEVFVKVSKGLKGFKGKSGISTWIYRIATNAALDRMRLSSSRRSPGEFVGEVEDKNDWIGHSKSRTDQSLVRKEMSECVREYIDKLPSDYKVVILLSELEGFKNREISDILQISLDAVKIRLHRARAALKKELDNGCDFYHNEQNIFACDRKDSTLKFRTPPKIKKHAE